MRTSNARPISTNPVGDGARQRPVYNAGEGFTARGMSLNPSTIVPMVPLPLGKGGSHPLHPLLHKPVEAGLRARPHSSLCSCRNFAEFPCPSIRQQDKHNLYLLLSYKTDI